jgi:hypothetical protein
MKVSRVNSRWSSTIPRARSTMKEILLMWLIDRMQGMSHYEQYREVVASFAGRFHLAEHLIPRPNSSFLVGSRLVLEFHDDVGVLDLTGPIDVGSYLKSHTCSRE